MDEQHLHSDYLNGEQPPVPIPPVSQGWDAMRDQLDVHLPVGKPFLQGPRNWWRQWWKLAAGIGGAAMVGAVIVWQVMTTQEVRTANKRPEIPGNIAQPGNLETKGLKDDNDSAVLNDLNNNTALNDLSKNSGRVAGENILHDKNDNAVLNSSGKNNGPATGGNILRGQQYHAEKFNPHTAGNAAPDPRKDSQDKDFSIPTYASATSGDKNHPINTGATNGKPNTPATTNHTAKDRVANAGTNTAIPKDYSTANRTAKDITAHSSSAEDHRLAAQDPGWATALNTTAATKNSGSMVEHNAPDGGSSRNPATDPPLKSLPMAASMADLISGHNTKPGTVHSDVVMQVGAADWGRSGLLQTWKLQLQWNLPLPLQGSAQYFSGPSGSSQPYRYLAPGLRVERSLGKGEVSLDVTPLASQALNPMVFKSEIDTMPGRQDSAAHSRALAKQFGSSAALQYHYSPGNHWGLSAGLEANWWHKGLILKSNGNDSLGRKKADSLTTGTAQDMKRFATLQFHGVAELYYKAGPWQAGLRMSIPLTKLGSDSANRYHSPVQASVVVRWTIPSLKKRK